MAAISVSQPGGGGTILTGGNIFPGTRCYPLFNGVTLSLAWTLTSVPTGSLAVLTGAAGQLVYFDPDVAGVYGLQLVGTGGADAGTYTMTIVCQSRGGGVGYMQSYEQQYFGVTASTVISGNTGTSGVVSFVPFNLPAPMAIGQAQMAVSMSFSTLGTSSGFQTATMSYGVYSRPLGSASTILSQIMASSYTIGVTGNNSTYTFNQPTSTLNSAYATGSTTSAGVNISSGYTGGKLIGLPINQTLSQGQYWLGIGNFHSTSSVICGISQSYLGQNLVATMATLAPIGSFSASFSSGTGAYAFQGGNWQPLLASFSSAGQTNLPSTVALSALTQNVSLVPYMRFLQTA
jgi:hypothetical protein